MENLRHWLEQSHLSPFAVLGTVVLLLATPFVITVLNRLLRGLVARSEHRLHLPYNTVLVATRIVSASLWLIAGTIILNLWGVSLSGLWTVLVSAIAVVGVGFLAVWTMISNVTASFFITVWRPFHLGQSVEILPDAVKGRVIDRNLMYTVLREEGGTVLQIPNNQFFQKMFRVSGGSTRYLLENLENEGLTRADQTHPG